jgi:hypothetical protein
MLVTKYVPVLMRMAAFLLLQSSSYACAPHSGGSPYLAYGKRRICCEDYRRRKDDTDLFLQQLILHEELEPKEK